MWYNIIAHNTEGKNVPRVYATSIRVPNMSDAAGIIDSSYRLGESDKIYAKRIISSLISSRSISRAGSDDAESRVDYISDKLGIPKSDVIRCINAMREDGILDDSKDLTAYPQKRHKKQVTLD